MSKTNIAIIGAGILGSAIALELGTAGHSVEVFSDDHNAKPATHASFGWINAHTPENKHHFQMRLESMRLWRALKSAYPAIPVRQITAIDWDMPETELEETQAQYSDLGHETHLLEADALKNAFPHLNLPETSAITSHNDMVAEPDQIASFFKKHAETLGVRFSIDNSIERIDPSPNGPQLVVNATLHQFDQVIIVAGTGSQALVEHLGYALPMNNRQGILLRSKAMEKELNCLISAPDFHCRQMTDGTIIAGSAQAGREPNVDVTALAKQLSEKMAELAPDFADIEFTTKTHGTRPEPGDGMPVIDVVGEHGNIHLAVMHSGITLAPFVAKAISHQVKTGKQHEKVAPYSLTRFQTVQEKIAI